MRVKWLVIPICLFALFVGKTSAGQPTDARELIEAKCTLCHTSHRIYSMGSSDLKELVSRMTAKNPDWFRETDSRHLLESLEAMLDDPEVSAMRVVWEKTIARGKEVFNDQQLGSNGKSCADCHDTKDLVKAKSTYPRFDTDRGRMVSLEEQLNYMVVEKLEGQPMGPGDERIVSLGLFIKSLR